MSFFYFRTFPPMQRLLTISVLNFDIRQHQFNKKKRLNKQETVPRQHLLIGGIVTSFFSKVE